MFSKQQLIKTILRNAMKAACVICLAGLAVFLFGREIAKTSKSLAEEKRASFLLRKQAETTQSLRTDLNRIGTNDARIERALLPDQNISAFLEALKILASQDGIQESIQASLPIPTSIQFGSSTLSEIDYTLQITGTGVIFVNFLKHLEAIPYANTIVSISGSAPQPQGLDGPTSFTLQGRVYVRPAN